MEYMILECDTPQELVVEVSDWMLKGWVPQGGLCVDHRDNLGQAMVRLVDEQSEATAEHG